MLECLYQDLAGLLELWTCLELPNDPASLARLSLNYSLELAEDVLLRHPFVPIAFAKWYTSLFPTASGPVTTAVAISGYVAENAVRTSSILSFEFGSGSRTES